jgi:hypothetical protein
LQGICPGSETSMAQYLPSRCALGAELDEAYHDRGTSRLFIDN